MSILAFLMGLLPFVNLFRAFPIPGLWTELATLLAFGLCLALQFGRKAYLPGRWQPLQVGVIVLIIAISIRSTGDDVAWGLLCCLVLLGALAVHAAFATTDSSTHPDDLCSLLVGWSAGVVLAFLLNALACFLAWQELEWVLHKLVPSRSPERWGGTFGQPNQMGVFAAMAITAVLFLEGRRKVSAWAAGAVVAIAILVIVMSGSRSAVLVWAWLWLTTRSLTSSTLVARGLFHGQWVLMLLGQVVVFAQVGGDAVNASGQVASVIARPSGVPRWEQWRDAWLLSTQNPWLGVGWGNFAEARFFDLTGSISEPEAAHTHNLFSQLIVELGVFGWLVSGACIWQGLYLLREVRSSVGAQRLPAALALSLLLYAMFEYPFWSLSFLFTFMWLCALATPSGPGHSVMSMGLMRIVGGGMLVAAMLLAFDYARFQARLMQVGVYLYRDEPKQVSEVDVLEVRRETFFADAVDEYWLDTSHRLDGTASLKWPVVQRLFARTPTAAGGVQYVLYAVIAGEEDRAALVLDRFRTSAPKHMFRMMLRALRNEATQDPVLQSFLDQYMRTRGG